MTAHKWQFSSRFRRHAFGWRSDTPIQRLKEAVTEIKQVARKDAVLAAEGAVTLLEKLSPALEQVDSSSGSMGSAVNRAIDTLVPIMAKADVDPHVRQRWLDRLWEAFQEDHMPYIESLGDHWGALCVTQESASSWADELLPILKMAWSSHEPGHGYFKGTSACLSSLLHAGRYDELLALLEMAPFPWWHNRRWGVQALVAMGKKSEALRYAETSRGHNEPMGQVAQACEAILLSSGLMDEAYQRYAIEANQATTHLATFRSIAKKYPSQPPEKILRDLIASTPGSEGKWFAAAKDAGLFDLATELASTSPTDPRTLARAARDFVEKQPPFAVAAGLAALHWISHGYGYDITSADVLDAYMPLMEAAARTGIQENLIKEQILGMIAHAPHQQFLKTALARYLS